MNPHSKVVVGVYLDSVLESVSIALRDLGQLASRVETAFLDVFHEIDAMEVDQTAIQQMDMILQSVEEIARLLDRIHLEVPAEIALDYQTIISPIRLERLRDLVAASESGADTQPSDVVSGIVSLF